MIISLSPIFDFIVLLTGQTNTVGFQVPSHVLHDSEPFARRRAACGRHDEKKLCGVSRAERFTRKKARNGRIREKASRYQGAGVYVLLRGFKIVLQDLQGAVRNNANCSGNA